MSTMWNLAIEKLVIYYSYILHIDEWVDEQLERTFYQRPYRHVEKGILFEFFDKLDFTIKGIQYLAEHIKQ